MTTKKESDLSSWGKGLKGANSFGAQSFGPKTSEVQGGFSTHQSSAAVNKTQQAGWGHKAQTAPAGFSTGKTGSTTTKGIGGLKGFGYSSFGTSGFGGSTFGKSAFGAFSQKAAPRRKVPTSTLGIYFRQREINVKGQNNQAQKKFKVCNITSIPMFAAYTIDELRIYDKISEGTLKPAEGLESQVGPTQQPTTTTTGGFGALNKQTTGDQKQETQSFDWARIHIDYWPATKPPESKVSEQPYGALQNSKLKSVTESVKKLPDEDIKFRQKLSLKGIINRPSFQEEFQNDNSLEEKDELIQPRIIYSNASDLGKSQTATRTKSMIPAKSFMSTKSMMPSSDKGLDYKKDIFFIPDILEKKVQASEIFKYKSDKNNKETMVSNLRITAELSTEITEKIQSQISISILFLDTVDIHLLDPVKIKPTIRKNQDSPQFEVEIPNISTASSNALITLTSNNTNFVNCQCDKPDLYPTIIPTNNEKLYAILVPKGSLNKDKDNTIRVDCEYDSNQST